MPFLGACGATGRLSEAAAVSSRWFEWAGWSLGGGGGGLGAGALGGTTADRQGFGKMLLVLGCIGTNLCK